MNLSAILTGKCHFSRENRLNGNWAIIRYISHHISMKLWISCYWPHQVICYWSWCDCDYAKPLFTIWCNLYWNSYERDGKGWRWSLLLLHRIDWPRFEQAHRVPRGTSADTPDGKKLNTKVNHFWVWIIKWNLSMKSVTYDSFKWQLTICYGI